MHCKLGGVITRTMTKNFREMKLRINGIFMNVFVEKAIRNN